MLKFKLMLIVFMLLSPTVLLSLAQDVEQTPAVEVFHDSKGTPMVLVPAGEFQSGIKLDEAIQQCLSLIETEGFPPYDPKQICSSDFIATSRLDPEIVDVNAFYLDQYEVSRADYIACVDADVCAKTPLMYQPSKPIDVPVQMATFYDAAIYCAWHGARLPTGTEWEYASRGSDNWNFPWGNEFDGNATNHCDKNCRVLGDGASLSIWDDGYSELAPVNAFEKDQSWIGAYNLGGNILEWTSSGSPLNQSANDDLRIIKGGSYDAYPYQTAGWFMNAYNATDGRPNIGFRCVRTTKP